VKRLGYVPALDGLRGAGIVTVIAVHYYGDPSGGFFSMEMFFALSGFLITTLLLQERDRTGHVELRAFFRRRVYRLLPALLTVLAAYAIVMSGSPARALKQVAVGGFYVANIFLAAGSHILDSSPQTPLWGALTPFWSLAQEEQFYLVWPLLLVLLLTRRVSESRIAVALACAFLALATYRAGLGLTGASWNRLYFGPDTHADGLVLGCLLALLRRRGLRIPQWAGWAGLASLAVAFALVPELPRATPEIAYGLAPMAIAGTLLVGAALEAGVLARCFSRRPVVWLGEISYSLYLWHMFIFWLFDWREPLVALAVTLVVATLCYYKIEKPLRTAFRSRSSPAVEIRPAPALSGEAA
jgi:peptidoglycan/LPS O-acetylase OafA/YrhL